MVVQIFGLALGAFSTGLDVWLGIGRIASQINQYIHIYGRVGVLLPYLANSDVFFLVEKVLWDPDDAVAMRFVDAQLQQINMVAVVGSVVAGVATSGLNLKYMSAAHWTSRAFILSSLLSGLFCVYYSMRQLRILGALITANDVRNWLRSPRERIRCKDKNRPSIRAVLVLDTPRALVTMASISYVVGLSIYLVCVHISNLDVDAGAMSSRDVMITYFVILWFCLALYTKADVFDHYKGRSKVWLDLVMMLIMLKKVVWGLSECECESELPDYTGDGPGAISPPISLPRYRTSPSARTAKVGGPAPAKHTDQQSMCSSSPSVVPRSIFEAPTVSSLDETMSNRPQHQRDDQRLLKALHDYREDWGLREDRR